MTDVLLGSTSAPFENLMMSEAKRAGIDYGYFKLATTNSAWKVCVASILQRAIHPTQRTWQIKERISRTPANQQW